MYYRLGRAGKALDRFGVVDFATTIAPGVRDVLLTGKVYEAAYRNKRSKGARRYDAIVLDAPPTGRIAQFLNVNSELAGLAKVGPIRTQADSIMTLLRSPRTAVHLVTVLEDMPVQETADGIAELHAARLPVGGVVVNLVRSNELDDEARDQAVEDGLPRGLIEEDLRRVGIEPTGTMLDGLLTEAREHAERRDLEDEQRKRIDELDVADLRAAPADRRDRPRRSLRAGGGPLRTGDGMSRQRSSSRVGPLAGKPQRVAAARRRRAPRRPGTEHHRVLRLGRRRQDHHGRGARAPGRRARPQGRRADHRPGAPAGAVDGHRGARQHAAAGAGRGRAGQGRRRHPRRDDARHEADLRRGRGGSGQPGEGGPDPGQPLLPARCRARSRARRSTWPWRSSASSTRTRGSRGAGT